MLILCLGSIRPLSASDSFSKDKAKLDSLKANMSLLLDADVEELDGYQKMFWRVASTLKISMSPYKELIETIQDQKQLREMEQGKKFSQGTSTSGGARSDTQPTKEEPLKSGKITEKEFYRRNFLPGEINTLDSLKADMSPLFNASIEELDKYQKMLWRVASAINNKKPYEELDAMIRDIKQGKGSSQGTSGPAQTSGQTTKDAGDPTSTFNYNFDDIKSKEDAFKLFGLPSTASRAQIIQKFKELSLKYHPDKHPKEQAWATNNFKAINEARRLLLSR